LSPRSLNQKPVRHIAVLKGGPSSEHEVSLRTGAAVAEALRSLGLFQVTEVVIETRDFVLPPDVDFAFICLHGTFGEDGELQALLEKRGLPYTGCGVAASRLAFDKEASKERFRATDVPTPEGVTVPKGGALPEDFPLPLVVKPSRQGSTVGMSFVFERDQVPAALEKAWEHDDRVLAERFVQGSEFTVGILGDEALPPVEIVPKQGFYDYANKYTAGATDYFCPPRVSLGTIALLKDLGLRAHRALGCHVYSRVDILIDREGKPWVLEVNTIPGMTATSLLPKAAAAAQIPFPELCRRLIDLSLAAFPETAAPFLEND
jgi:D-alanine-D-alanine ligase